MTNIEKIIVSHSSNIRDAIKKMDEIGKGIVVVTDNKSEVIGIITDGDFRRAILKGVNLKESVLSIVNNNYISATVNESALEIEAIYKNNAGLKQLPILDNRKLVKLITHEELFLADTVEMVRNSLENPVIIMAGGKGTRLEPFTNILPKPLIPIGQKTILEHIITEFRKHSIPKFYISVNYKANMLKAYMADLEKDYTVDYIYENKPLGTIGALKSVEGEFTTSIFVTNSDIIIKDDYSNILEFHKKGGFKLTLVASMQHYKIPYGVCEINEGGELKKIEEKPEYDFLVNTGMYILEPDVLKYIPEDTFFNITDLMEVLKLNNHRIGVYPVSEKSWIDIGQWDEYKKTLKRLDVGI